MADQKLKVPQHAEADLTHQLIQHGVPKEDIERAGGAGGFLAKFISGLGSGQYPLLKKLIETLVTAGINSLGGGGTSGGASTGGAKPPSA